MEKRVKRNLPRLRHGHSALRPSVRLPEPPKPPPLPWYRHHAFILALAVLLIGLVSFGGWYLLARSASRGRQLSATAAGVPPCPEAGVLAGAPLAWRELASWEREGLGAAFGPEIRSLALASGDFDGTGEDGLLVLRETIESGAQRPRSLALYRLDGTAQPVQLAHPGYMSLLAAWDYLGDGTAEVVVGVHEGQTPVYGVDGTCCAVLPGRPWSSVPLRADVDGDGLDELVLAEPASEPVRLSAFDVNGEVTWRSLPWEMGYPAVGDVDGDGRDELLGLARKGLTAHGVKQAPALIWGWPEVLTRPAGLDLSGDGIAEIVSSRAGYLDVASGHFTQLEVPLDAVGFLEAICPPLACDIDADGVPELVIAAGYAGCYERHCLGTALYAFETSGQLAYREELGEHIAALGVARAAGGEHLAVLTQTRLLVYP